LKNYLRVVLSLILALVFATPAFAAITGTISGTVTDSSGAVVPGAKVVALDQQTGISRMTTSDSKGFYSFPDLAIGNYSISTSVTNFQSFEAKDIRIDANSAVRTDISLKVGSVTTKMVVTANPVTVETVSSSTGEVIDSEKMTAVPLNGRSFTDLLALQPGVAPYAVETGGALAPSGSLTTGNVSVNGGRGASNGFMVNGIDVNDGVENSTAIVPNLDSLEEFRIITSNYDAEYGNFSGGQVNVVTKGGTNVFHGEGFEFLRNTVFNARGYSFLTTPPTRGNYNQSIYGGTFGGPIKKDKIFFFGDFQGTYQKIGTSDSSSTPSATDLTGNVTDWATLLNGYGGTVNGTGWAGVLTNRLGYTVSANEPYFGASCTTTTACVFPGYTIPTRAWDPVAAPIIAAKYIPTPNSSQSNAKFAGGLQPYFVTTANSNTLKDYKEGGRVDFNTRYGDLFAYYFLDRDIVGNPYGGGTDGQFPDATQDRAQMANIGITTIFKNNSVNSFRFGYVRNAAQIGNPTYKTPGPSLGSLGFVTPWGPTGGIGNIASGLAGVPQISISEGGSFGTPTETQGRYVNTFQWVDNYTKVVGTHTYQFGVNYHYDQIDERNYYDVNGGFSFADSNETGLGFADFLLGAENGSFTQASPQILDSRSHYAAGYVQDSWRIKNNLTLNYGVRYEITTPWYDTQNKLETIIPGEQSVVFPGAPKGWVFPGDRGVHRTLGPIHYDKFAPRFGFAYVPKTSGSWMDKVTGGDKLSIRGSVGFFYTNFQDESGFVEVGDAPYGLYYQAPVQTMLSTPYVDRGTQNIELQKFPFSFPPTNVSASNPDNNIPWASYEPLSSSDAIGANNTTPYIESYFLGLQRELGRGTVLTLNYVGSQGRHLADSQEANPGVASICLGLTAATLAPGQAACKPKAESNKYELKNGSYVYGTRTLDQDNGEGLAFGANPYLNTNATSNYNSAQISLKHNSKIWNALIGYTYGKSMDDASTLTDYANPFNASKSYSLSSYNVKQYMVASYTVHIPVEMWTANRTVRLIAGGWSVTGITKMAAGQPIAMSDSEDWSLCGCSGVDFPYYTPGNLFAGGAKGAHNPRDFVSGTSTRYPYFNTSLFTAEGKEGAAYGIAGNSLRRFFPGPGLDHTDVTIQRDFHLYHAHTVAVRLEAFNVLNHAEFAAPTGSVTSSTFGVVSAQDGAPNGPRILQVAAKYSF
jgi:hypothetical protein